MRCILTAILLAGLSFVSPAYAYSQSTSDTPAVQVQHHPQRSNGWKIADSPNFRIFYLDDFDHPEQMLRGAEKARAMVIEKWLTKGVQPQWPDRCWIVVYSTAESYSRGTGAPASSPGHSNMTLDGSRIISLQIFLHSDYAEMESAVLPHEVTHATIAGQFGESKIPRWADEGMAVLSEPEAKVKKHLDSLPAIYKDGISFKAGDLMAMKDYPERTRIPAFYAQSVSLVHYLSSLKDTRTFGKFLKDGLKNGYEDALKQHYGIEGTNGQSATDVLDRMWRQHVNATPK